MLIMGLGWFLWVVLTLSRLALAVADDRRVLQAAAEKGLFTDTQALMSFKQRIERDPHAVLNGWNVQTSSNSCDWFGVTCANSRVVALNLTGCGLLAPLPTAALAPLDQLQDLRLSGNGFYGYGSDQEVASACNTLTSLDLSSNNLTGTFSSLFLQNCNTLTYLNISHNIFRGGFPPNVLGDNSSVRWLDLSCNNFSGILQSDLFAHCGALSWLDISGNSLSGSLPSGVAKCSTLEHLDLSNNLLNGTLPADLFPTSASASNLTFLSLSSNQITGFLPDMASCANLAYMDLSDNHFTGQIPSSMGACTSLRLLNISFNNLIGDLPASLASLGSLELLYLSDNNITGTIPPEFGDSLFALQGLDLSGNKLVGTIPTSFSNCTSLHYLNLGDNGLSGIFPEGVVSRMTSLQTLIMSFNNLTGSLPASLSNSSYLAKLDLSANGLTGTIPDTLCGPVLRQLLVADNDLTGAVPLGSCANLVTIDMSCNFLSGTLPASLPALPYLQEIIMWGNLIEGEIPPNICSAASQLKKLILNVNLFTGTIPPTLANCSSLEWLTLTSNLLTGSIPPELGFMPRINMLQLGNNSLSGTIPTTLGNCKMLIWLDLSSNQLVGSIPTELANQSGKVIKGTLGGTSFAFLKFLQRPGCAGLGALLAFADIRPERLDEIPNFKRCNLTRLYLGIQPYYFPGPAGGSLQYLDLANNKLTGTIPEEIGTMSYLQVLSLSYNALTGTIPPSLANLVHVTIFHLDHNNLQGPIPPGLAKLGLINQLDLSSNNLSGTIPSSGTLSTFPPSVYAENPYLCGPPLLPCDAQAPGSGDGSAQGMSTSSSSDQWSGVSVTMAALGTFVFVMACMCGLAACLLSNHQRMRHHLRDHYMENLPSSGSGSGSWNISSAGEPLSINVATFEKPLRKLTFAHLLEATKGFSSEAIIGRGGFGDVYKATLEDGTVVAIKKLIPLVGQGDREFMAEMETIGKIKHRNLVPLLGYCRVGEERLLVYEYMEGGSLDKRFHGNVQNNSETLVDEGAGEPMGLSWDMRKRVALGTARGLCFLHHSCIPHIIHRDLKSSNVLLDDALEARVSDFGMARLVSASETHLSVSSVVGTPGYVPPEYCHSFRCTTKGDVYSFGVILLELITGRRPTWSSSAVRPPNNLTPATAATPPTTTTTSDLDNKVVAQQEHDEGGVDLVGWVKRHVRAGRERELLDEEALTSGMIATVDLEKRVVEMRRYLDIACWCVEERPWKRPNMLQVMALFRELHQDQDLDPSE